MWEKLNDDPKLYRHNKHGLWLIEIDGQQQLLSMPQASVADVQALLQSIVDLKHAAANAATAAQSAHETHAQRARR
jgi:hypothetical protein